MPLEAELEAVFLKMDKLYMKVSTPREILQFDRILLSQYLRRIIPYIKREASPGVPYSVTFKNNGQMIDGLGETLITMVINRIRAIHEWNGEFDSREDLVIQNLMDPVRLFIKNEPHAIDKCQMGRFRLIMSVSLVDKLVEMVFHLHTNKQQILNWKEIPSKPGMGFTLDMCLSIYNQCADFGLQQLAAADISGWDWSVKKWLLDAEARYRVRLQTQTSTFYETMLAKKAILDAHSIYQMSDGMLVHCDYAGLQNSGKFNTSSGNSIMRIIVAFLVGSEWGIAMGDDCIESVVPGAQRNYLELGFRCKMYTPIEEEFEFCSHIFSSKGAYALNINKSIMRLLQNDKCDIIEKKLLTMQFEDDIVNSPEFDRILDCLERVGWYAKICPQRKY